MSIKQGSVCFYSKICFEGGFMLYFCYFYFYVYWCPTRYQYNIIFASFNSNTTSATDGTWTIYHSGAPEVPSVLSWVCVTQSLVFCVVFWRTLFIFLSFFFRPLYCMSFFRPLYCMSFELRLLISSFLSSNFSFYNY
jgi:hypothetical protein